ESHARDLAQRGVRFLWRLREHADAHAALLRAVLQRRTLRLADDLLAAGANKLTDGRHKLSNAKSGDLDISTSVHSIGQLNDQMNKSLDDQMRHLVRCFGPESRSLAPENPS